MIDRDSAQYRNEKSAWEYKSDDEKLFDMYFLIQRIDRVSAKAMVDAGDTLPAANCSAARALIAIRLAEMALLVSALTLMIVVAWSIFGVWWLLK